MNEALAADPTTVFLNRRPQVRVPSRLGWISGVALRSTLTQAGPALRGFTCVRCCGSPRASIPHDLTAKLDRDLRARPRAVASGSRFPPAGSVRDSHPQSFVHAWRTPATPSPSPRSSAGAFPSRSRPSLSSIARPFSGQGPAQGRDRYEHPFPAVRRTRLRRGRQCTRRRSTMPASPAWSRFPKQRR